MSEGITEIRINSQPCMSINLTTRHTQAQRAPRVAIIHDEVNEMIRAHLTLVHVFHAYASPDTPWVAHAPVRYGRIAFVSATHGTTQFGDSICLVCVSTFQMLVQQGSTDAGLNRHRRELPPWSSEYQIRSLPFLSIQYSLFSLNCPTRSHFKLFYHLFKFLTFLSWTRVSKSHKISRVESATRLLPEFYPLSIALLTDFPPQ
jgi:hypothetical protein